MLSSNSDSSQEVQVSIAYCEFLVHIEANWFAEDGKDDAEVADLTYFRERVLQLPADVYTRHHKPALLYIRSSSSEKKVVHFCFTV